MVSPHFLAALVFSQPPFPVTPRAGDIWWLLGQLLVLFGGIYLFLAQSLYLWRRRRLWKSLLMDGCIDIFLFLQSLALLLSAITYLSGLEEYVPLMVFSLLLGWVNMLYYTRGFQQTGIYIVMIQKAILRDLLHFLMVYVIFLFGFATALVILTGTAPHGAAPNASLVPAGGDDGDKVRYTGLLTTSLELFKFTIGMGELEFHENVHFKYLVMLLLLLFVVLTYILLLNMLIALMSETVTNVSGFSQSVWKLQASRAALVAAVKAGPKRWRPRRDYSRFPPLCNCRERSPFWRSRRTGSGSGRRRREPGVSSPSARTGRKTGGGVSGKWILSSSNIK
uniref:Ion transport domain-containing protein n=1 Tax=Anolis carolinensis TaxID=28377 RepID=A0A803T4P6_ANOCA